MGDPLGAGLESLLYNFYTTSRAGSLSLSDGGGPLGFDITVALQIEFLIRSFACDGVIETGCHYGDTTAYFARQYPALPVMTCDIDEPCARFTQARCARFSNVQVMVGDSAELLGKMVEGLARPLILLDAHWYDPWPLPVELATARFLSEAVVCVDDFYIAHPRFGFDEYGQRCDAELVACSMPSQPRMFIGDPHADYPFPCLQVGRRAGTGYIAVGLDDSLLAQSALFRAIDLSEPTVLPRWG
jgi:hypothetical protein